MVFIIPLCCDDPFDGICRSMLPVALMLTTFIILHYNNIQNYRKLCLSLQFCGYKVIIICKHVLVISQRTKCGRRRRRRRNGVSC